MHKEYVVKEMKNKAIFFFKEAARCQGQKVFENFVELYSEIGLCLCKRAEEIEKEQKQV